MIWTRRHTVVAGLALILGANAIVLGGVTYNRGGEPEAQLRMTERELTAPGSWGFGRENSGLSMRLQWRVASFKPTSDDGYGYSDPDWLNDAKLTELGFDLSRFRGPANDYYDSALPRDALLVLEMDGAGYQAALERAERRAATSATSIARLRLEDVRNKESRLYVVDAGLDAAALRAKYPDRSRHAIVRGQVLAYRAYDNRTRERLLRGQVSNLAVVEINVPLALRGAVDRNTPFEAVVAFGRRLEPWFVSAAPRSKPPSN